MLLCILLLVVLLQACVVSADSCTTRINVSGEEGGDAILRVHQTRITSIIWVLLREGSFLVRTKPGEPIDDEELTEPYRGRVRSDPDGSLHIYNLSSQDQRMYTADIRTRGGPICIHYNLTVYERLSPGDLHITHTITRNDICSLVLVCSMERRDVTITWSSVPSSDINVTQGVLYVRPSCVNYTYICTARNPVSNISKTVIPGEYCKPQQDFSETSVTRRHLLCWILSGIVLLITGCVLIHHIKSEVIKPSGET